MLKIKECKYGWYASFFTERGDYDGEMDYQYFGTNGWWPSMTIDGNNYFKTRESLIQSLIERAEKLDEHSI